MEHASASLKADPQNGVGYTPGIQAHGKQRQEYWEFEASWGVQRDRLKI
jgi:hypothetical protein